MKHKSSGQRAGRVSEPLGSAQLARLRPRAGRSARCHECLVPRSVGAATAGPAPNQGRAGPGPGPGPGQPAPSSHARQPRSTQGAREGSSSARSPQHLPDQLLPQGQGVVAVALRRPHGRSPLSRPLSSSPRCRGGAAAAAHAGRPQPGGARPQPLPLRAAEPAALRSGAWWIWQLLATSRLTGARGGWWES